MDTFTDLGVSKANARGRIFHAGWMVEDNGDYVRVLPTINGFANHSIAREIHHDPDWHVVPKMGRPALGVAYDDGVKERVRRIVAYFALKGYS